MADVVLAPTNFNAKAMGSTGGPGEVRVDGWLGAAPLRSFGSAWGGEHRAFGAPVIKNPASESPGGFVSKGTPKWLSFLPFGFPVKPSKQGTLKNRHTRVDPWESFILRDFFLGGAPPKIVVFLLMFV